MASEADKERVSVKGVPRSAVAIKSRVDYLLMKLSGYTWLILLLAPLDSGAACWKQLDSSSMATISIDLCSISKDGSYSKAWLKWDYQVPQVVEGVPGKTYAKVISQDYINCKNRTFASIRATYYGGGNQDVVKSEVIDSRLARFDEPPPDTVGETILNYVCKR